MHDADGNVIAAVLIFVWSFGPFLWLVLMSFKTNAEIFRFPPRLFFEATWANYAALWTSEFRNSFSNSLIVGVVSTVLSLLIGNVVAIAQSNLKRARIKKLIGELARKGLKVEHFADGLEAHVGL